MQREEMQVDLSPTLKMLLFESQLCDQSALLPNLDSFSGQTMESLLHRHEPYQEICQGVWIVMPLPIKRTIASANWCTTEI
jgi:hypothetical protein